MSIEARRQYLSAIQLRYQNARKFEKTRILDEFCQVCGYSRKYAIRVLQGRLKPRLSSRPGPSPLYGPALVRHLVILWEAMNRICSKKMKSALPLWLPYYRAPDFTAEIRELLLKISPATIDRHLAPHRRSSLRGISTTQPRKMTWIKSQIPIELLHARVTEPGFIEADTVAHCGDSVAGTFASSLTMTDLQSGWTENRACLGKDSLAVLQQIQCIERSLPFPMQGFACDNGTEFLNESLLRHFQERNTRPVKFVRRRPYKKNDAAHVEQKNWTHVRQLFGYERIEDPDLVAMMNEIYRWYWNPLLNYFTPTMKLAEKTRVGAKLIKRYEKTPRTPYDRLMANPALSGLLKQPLHERRSLLNPFKLKQELDRKLKIFFQLVEIYKRRVA